MQVAKDIHYRRRTQCALKPPVVAGLLDKLYRKSWTAPVAT